MYIKKERQKYLKYLFDIVGSRCGKGDATHSSEPACVI